MKVTDRDASTAELAGLWSVNAITTCCAAGSKCSTRERNMRSGSLPVTGALSRTIALRSRSISMPERTRSCPVVVVPSRVAMSDIVSKCRPRRGSAAMKKSRFAAVLFFARCDVVAARRWNFGRRETFNTYLGHRCPARLFVDRTGLQAGFDPEYCAVHPTLQLELEHQCLVRP